eukprot:TRINITY_DN20423_c0_g1_i1.p1 TRINITY_DN20423_c0_g1~~TRINITY_DN20423_c0_g1_i1.p1  ORF type:complete len:302 (+),score=34.48 TRINITY_DN20423_c0_g1_i1:82-987(+)
MILGLDTTTKKGIFLSYMLLWSALRLITYGSKQEGSSAPKYNETSLLIFVCFAKLIIAVVMFLRADGNVSEMLTQLKQNGKLFARYFLPALSYVVYDNLTFINLSLTDPVTYVILMQMRIVVTGLVWSVFFSKPLNKNQWYAIGLLTAACLMQKGVGILNSSNKADTSNTILSIALIGAQIACGVFASVFNELLLKEKGSAGVNLQNTFMYTHSIICNVTWLLLCPSKTWCKGDLFEAMQPEQLTNMFHPWILPIGIILASIGIVLFEGAVILQLHRGKKTLTWKDLNYTRRIRGEIIKAK